MQFYKEKDLALCGLACVLCSAEDCHGCKARGCKEGSDCSVYQCVMKKELDGCYQCDDFPCDEKMLSGIRNRAFNQYAKQYGKQMLLDRLHINYENGIAYHKPDGLKGDYDLLEAEDDIMRLIRFGTHDPYIKCPVFEMEHFAIRFVEKDDAADLLECYSDKSAQEIFNDDNCTFGYGNVDALEKMQHNINLWIDAFKNKHFIRFAIVEKMQNKAIGTIEMFGGRGILRVDIVSELENEKYLHELFSLAINEFFLLFGVDKIVTKAAPAADKRIKVLSSLGFEQYDLPNRKHYWVKSVV